MSLPASKNGPENRPSTRKERVAQLMAEALPIANIAIIVGVDYGYAWKLCREIDPDYKPSKNQRAEHKPVRSLSESFHMRAILAELLYALLQKHSKQAVATLTGLRIQDQKRAVNRPYTHDWSLSQMQAVAEASDVTLEQVVRTSLCSKPISISPIDTTKPAR